MPQLPRQLLRAIPGVELVEIPDGDRCCGSAGVYSLTQPDLAGRLGRQKIAAIAKTDADVIVSANPGCLIQIRSQLARAGQRAPVAHLADLLDAAYRVAP